MPAYLSIIIAFPRQFEDDAILSLSAAGAHLHSAARCRRTSRFSKGRKKKDREGRGEGQGRQKENSSPPLLEENAGKSLRLLLFSLSSPQLANLRASGAEGLVGTKVG